MKFIRIIALFGFLAFISCKKNRSCVCTNSQGIYNAGEVEMTKSQARKYCKGLSSGETTCELKD